MARIRTLLGSIRRSAQRALAWFEALRPVYMLAVMIAVILASTALAFAGGSGTTSITGLVYDGYANVEIAGASVVLVDTATNETVGMVSTDELGTFTFADLPVGPTYRADVYWNGYFPDAANQNTFDTTAFAGPYTGVQLTMYPDWYDPYGESGGGGGGTGGDPNAQTIYGTIIDGGPLAPLSGATVELISVTYNPDTDSNTYAVADTATTGTNGAFAFTVAYGSTYVVRASAPGYDYEYMGGGSGATVASAWQVTLEEGVTDSYDASIALDTTQAQITGVVTDAITGDPLANAYINVSHVNSRAGYPPVTEANIYTDWDGRYRQTISIGTEYYLWVDDNPVGGYLYYPVWWGNGAAYDMYTDAPTMTATDEFPVISQNVALVPYEISGVATDASTGSPLEGVDVYLYQESAVDSGVYQLAVYTTTGPLGTYSFHPLDSDLGYKVSGVKTGYITEFQDGATAEADAAALRFWDGTRTNWNLTTGEPDPVITTALSLGVDTPAPTSCAVTGTITDSTSGAAIAGATVNVFTWDATEAGYVYVPGSSPTTTTNASGGYSFDLPVGNYKFYALATGYTSKWVLVDGLSVLDLTTASAIVNTTLVSTTPVTPVTPSNPTNNTTSVPATSEWALALAALAGLAVLVRSRRRRSQATER